MKHTQFQESIPTTLREISSALFALHDDLVELSLRLHDLQFEMDQEEREKAETAFWAAFEKMRSTRSSDESDGPR
jgi:hypothetical protein